MNSFDTSNDSWKANISVGTNPSFAVVVGTKLYVNNAGSANISVIDVAKDTVLATINLSSNPTSSVVVGTKIYVMQQGNNIVSVIDSTNNTVSPISVGSHPVSATLVNGKLYVNNSTGNTVSVIDTSSNTVTTTINVGTSPVSSSLVGSKLYVNNSGSNNVSVIDTNLNSLVTTVTVGTSPIASSVIGTKVYVDDSGSNDVDVIDTTVDTLYATVSTGLSPRFSSVLGNKVYVSNFTSNTVTTIDTQATTYTSGSCSVPMNPTLVRATVTGSSLVMKYTKSLDSTSVPSTSQFVVTRNGSPISISSVSISGVNVTLTLATPIVFGDTVTLDYTVPVSHPLQDTSANLATALAGQAVINATPDTTVPTFTMQTYTDAALTLPIADNATLKAGTYYVKISSSAALLSPPTITINAEGTANDITNVATTLISGNTYSYTYTITSDAAAVGTVLADFSVTGVDMSGKQAASVDPTNETTKAFYTDTIADAAPGTPDMTAATDLGNSSTDNITSDTTPDFAITCATGSTVTLYDGLTAIGSSLCTGSTVTITSSILSVTTHTSIYATQTDHAGNISPASTSLTVTISMIITDGATAINLIGQYADINGTIPSYTKS